MHCQREDVSRKFPCYGHLRRMTHTIRRTTHLLTLIISNHAHTLLVHILLTDHLLLRQMCGLSQTKTMGCTCGIPVIVVYWALQDVAESATEFRHLRSRWTEYAINFVSSQRADFQTPVPMFEERNRVKRMGLTYSATMRPQTIARSLFKEMIGTNIGKY